MCYYYAHFIYEEKLCRVTRLVSGESRIQTQVCLTPVAEPLQHILHHLSLYPEALFLRESKHKVRFNGNKKTSVWAKKELPQGIMEIKGRHILVEWIRYFLFLFSFSFSPLFLICSLSLFPCHFLLARSRQNSHSSVPADIIFSFLVCLFHDVELRNPSFHFSTRRLSWLDTTLWKE